MHLDYQDLTGQSLQHLDQTEVPERIVGTCLYQELPLGEEARWVEVFPAGCGPIEFVACNLDNVLLPEGSTTEGCSHRLIATLDDTRDWLLDPESGEPLEEVG